MIANPIRRAEVGMAKLNLYPSVLINATENILPPRPELLDIRTDHRATAFVDELRKQVGTTAFKI